MLEIVKASEVKVTIYFLRNLILCGSMDRQSFILDCSQCEVKVVQRFEKHEKYVCMNHCDGNVTRTI